MQVPRMGGSQCPTYRYPGGDEQQEVRENASESTCDKGGMEKSPDERAWTTPWDVPIAHTPRSCGRHLLTPRPEPHERQESLFAV